MAVTRDSPRHALFGAASTARALPARHGLIGSLATALSSQVVLLASGILIARALGVEGRGTLALIMLVPSALAQLGTAGLPLALTYEVASDAARSPLLTRTLNRTITLQALGLMVLTAGVLLALVDGPDRVAAAAAAPILPALVLQQYGLAVLQGAGRFPAFNCARVAPAALYALGLLALVAAGRPSLLEVVVVWTAVNALVAVPLAVVLARHARTPSDGVESYDLGRVRRFALRAIAGSPAPGDALRVDQVVVACVLPRSALGLYVVALAFTNLPRFISQSLGMVALPVRAAAARLGDNRDLRRLYLAVLLGTAGTVVVALELTVGRLVPFLFGAEFVGAVTVARVLLLGALVLAVRRVLADLAQGAGYPGAGAIAEGTYLLVAIPAACVAAAAFGITGVAAAVVLAAAASLVAMLAATHRPRSLSAGIPSVEPRAAQAAVVTGRR